MNTNISRRVFVKRGAIALASIGTSPWWMPSFLNSTVFAADPAKGGGRKILVCIFQRGAVDGLSMVVPFGDKDYYRHRNEIALKQPVAKAGDEACIDLDGFFGLHPALAPLLPIYKEKHFAIIHACGSPSQNRSHFDMQDFMESGTADDKSVATGWLNRALLECPEDRAKLTPFRAVAMTPILPRCLHGDHEALAIPDIRTFGVGARNLAPARPNVQPNRPQGGMQQMGGNMGAAKGFEQLYENAVGDVLGGAGREAFEAIEMLKKADPTKYQPQNGANYGNTNFGRTMLQIAQLIKSNVGLEVAFAEIGGWDTHANQGAAQGQLANRLREFGGALAAFYKDLGDKMSDVVVLTMSEFGRTIRQNGARGTDHGHATAFTVMGGAVNGGKVLGRWPGLADEQLFQRRDLMHTTDYRDVFAEIAQKHLGAKDLTKVFPKYRVDAKNYRGVLRV